MLGNGNKQQRFEELPTDGPIHEPEVAITLPEEIDHQRVLPPISINGTPPMTEHGRVIAQERGKGHVVPQQESLDPY